jgi:hypothetical protein
MAKRKPPPHAFKRGAKNPGHRSRRPETGAGRKKGTPNKISSDIKQHILNALNDLPGKLSGEGWFKSLAKRDMRSMAGLVGKCIPAKIEPATDPEQTAQKIRERMRAMNDLTTGAEVKPKEKSK